MFLQRSYFAHILCYFLVEFLVIAWFEQFSLQFVQMGYLVHMLASNCTVLYHVCALSCVGMAAFIQGFNATYNIVVIFCLAGFISWCYRRLHGSLPVMYGAALLATCIMMFLNAGFAWTNWQIFGTMIMLFFIVYFSVRHER